MGEFSGSDFFIKLIQPRGISSDPASSELQEPRMNCKMADTGEQTIRLSWRVRGMPDRGRQDPGFSRARGGTARAQGMAVDCQCRIMAAGGLERGRERSLRRNHGRDQNHNDRSVLPVHLRAASDQIWEVEEPLCLSGASESEL